MLCEKCQKQKATVHFTEVKNNEKKIIYLCNECAENHQHYIKSPALSYSVTDLLGGLIQMVASKSQAEESKMKCEHCGLDYHQFHLRGRLGCAHDYKAFRKKLKQLLNQIHGSNNHIGKVPKKLRKEQKLADLKLKLQKLVKQEKYEQAAEVRDTIKELEKSNGAK